MDNDEVVQQPERPTMPAGVALETDDLIWIRQFLISMVDGLQKGKKSRERSLVITKLQEAFMWAGEGLRLE